MVISAFGLGEDFDEDLMKGIAENGIGAYFFIENSDSIPSFVDFALLGIQNSVGNNALLTFRGVDTCFVKKIYGNYDVAVGARIGDLRADNVRTIMANLEVRTSETEGIITVLGVTLTYEFSGTTFQVTRSLDLEPTNDQRGVTENRNPEAVVESVLRKIGKLDKKLKNALSSEQVTEALEIQKKHVLLLEDILVLDTEILKGQNKIDKRLEQAKEDLKKLEEDGVTQKYKKEVHHREYMNTRM